MSRRVRAGFSLIRSRRKRFARSRALVRSIRRSIVGQRRVGTMFRAPRRSRALANIRTGGFLGIENKFVDYSIVATAIGSPAGSAGGEMDPAGSVNCLNAVAQGDGEQQRDGRKIKLNSVHLRGHIHRAVATDQADMRTGGAVFIALVSDAQTNGTQLNSEDVYENSSGNADGAVHSFRNLQYTQRFKVLWSRLYSFDAPNAGTDGTNTNSTGGQIRNFKVDIPLSFVTQFSASTAVVASINDTSLHVIAFATDAGYTLTYLSRVRFVG